MAFENNVLIIKGIIKRCNNEKFCVIDDFKEVNFFKTQEDMVYFLAENYYSQIENIKNDLDEETKQLLSLEYGFTISEPLEQLEIAFIKNAVKRFN